MTTILPALPTCPWCGSVTHHTAMLCPYVRAIEYYPDGNVKRVEFQDAAATSPPLPSTSTVTITQPPNTWSISGASISHPVGDDWTTNP